MQSDDHVQRAAEIIRQIEYITLATADNNGKPWNSPVYAAFDDELNFYWFSDKDSQHSENVRRSGEAFAVIYDSTVPADTGEGVYIEVIVQELATEDEILFALQAMDQRQGKKQVHDFRDYSERAILHGYKAIPQKMWMNDVVSDQNGNYIRDFRVPVSKENVVELLRTKL